MRSVTKFLCGGLLVLALPATAGAQSPMAASGEKSHWVSPFLGNTMGNDQTHANATMGVSAGMMVYKGWLGVEGEYADALVFFKDNGFLTHRQLKTAMGNVVVKVPYIKSEKLQVYATGGLGLVRPHLEEAGGFAVAEMNKLGFSAGAGATGFFNKNIGVRVDLRYLRTLKDDKAANAFGIDFGSFGFWRSSVGAVIRF